MPSPFFGRKKSTTPSNAASPSSHDHSSTPSRSSPLASPVEKFAPPSPGSSPEKKDKTYFGRDRQPKDKRAASPRSSKTFSRSTNHSRKHSSTISDEHPLNLHPDELRRLSFLSTMSSPRENGGDPMEQSSPAPEAPGAFPQSNESGPASPSTKSSEKKQEQGPAVPPHRQQSSSPRPQQAAAPTADAEALKASGNQFYKAGQYARAIDEYTKAIEADPSSAMYLNNRAAAYMAANMYPQALEDCKTANDLEPNSAKILSRLAKVYTAMGQPDEALLIYDQMQPPPSAKDKAPALAMQMHIKQAADSLEEGNTGSMTLHALDQAERALPIGVSPPRKWRLMRGEAHLKIGNINSLGEAQSIAMVLLRNNNADPEALVLRGRALYAQGDNEKAIQHFRQALACDPDYRDAVKYLRLVQKLDKMKEEGNTHFKAARYQQAIDIYTQALEVDPFNKGTNSKLLNNRAMCFSKLKQWTQAVEDCDKAVQFDPSYVKARKTKAKALGEGGDWDAAVKAYKEIQEQNPEEPGIAKDVRYAELELKKSKRKDHYKILGIEKDASDHEIKRAYKKLAVIHHPDKNIGDPDAENRFKDIQEAHETLIDPQKRQRYDSGVDLMEPGEGFGGGGFPGGMGGFGGGGMQIDPEMLFNMMGGAGRGGGGGFSFGGMPRGGQRGFPGGAGGFPF